MLFMRLISICTLFITFSVPAGASNEAAVAPFSKLPAAARSSISAALGRELPDYYVKPAGAGFCAVNPSQKFKIRFTATGVELQSGSTRWRMALRGYRYGDALKTFELTAPYAHLNRVEYRRGPITEWYVNEFAGLQQGFTIEQPPATAQSPLLTLALAISGDLAAAVDDTGSGLILTDRRDNKQMLYRGLSVHDAQGKELSAHLEVQGKRLLLSVQTAAAVYPLTVESWVQVAELSASDGAANDELGWSVAISGNTVVVGAPAHQVGSNPAQGAAYVFVEPETGWASMTQVAELTSSDGAANDAFGSSVAISGNTVVIGAPGANVGGYPYQGAAYVFVEPGGGWQNATETAKLTASDGTVDNIFGASVAIDGAAVVVGAPYVSVGSNLEQGAAYVFSEPVTGWGNMTQTARLTALDGAAGDIFGVSVSINSGAIVVGASNATVDGNLNAGKAYVFQPSGGWANTTQTAELSASDAAADNYFGASVGISGNTVLVGAPSDFAGAAYVFVEPAGGWANMTQTAELIDPAGPSLELLGSSVSISHGVAVVGAPLRTTDTHATQGAVFVFSKPASGWSNTAESLRFGALDGAAGDQLGHSVFVRGDIVAGAPFHLVGSNADQGVAYVFAVKNPKPLVTSLVPSNASVGGSGFTLTVKGSNFASKAVVNWSGSPRTTTRLSKTELQAVILASDIATAGTYKVTVTNPPPGGGNSTSVTFTVDNPLPVTSSLSPSSALAGGSALTLTVQGSNFIPRSKVQWNGVDLVTTFVSADQLTATLPGSDIKNAGTGEVTVFNPAPGGGVSNAQTFTVKNPVPSLTKLSPSEATAGGPGFTLTLTGTNFVSTSQVMWNGSVLSTTFVKKTELQAAVAASDIATAGTAQVDVTNPAPGGGTSNVLSFEIK
jgi:hypothetical protein